MLAIAVFRGLSWLPGSSDYIIPLCATHALVGSVVLVGAPCGRPRFAPLATAAQSV